MPESPERRELLRFRHTLWKADQEFAHKIIDPLDVQRDVKAEEFQECSECGAAIRDRAIRTRCVRCYMAAMDSIHHLENRYQSSRITHAREAVDHVAFDLYMPHVVPKAGRMGMMAAEVYTSRPSTKEKITSEREVRANSALRREIERQWADDNFEQLFRQAVLIVERRMGRRPLR